MSLFFQVPFDDGIATNECDWKRKVLNEILTDFFHLDCNPVPLTAPVIGPCYVFAQTPAVMRTFLTSWQPHLRNDRFQCPKIALRLVRDEGAYPETRVTHTSTPEITLILNPELRTIRENGTFLPESYYHHLKTRTLGRVVWYGQVVTSTMDLLDR